jgi:hypothetical protein
MTKRLPQLVALAIFLAGCPDDSSTEADTTPDSSTPVSSADASTGTTREEGTDPTPVDTLDAAAADTDASRGSEDDSGNVSTDAGSEVGSDGGVDAGAELDAGTDAGLDAGADAGTDGGLDGGLDASTDAGADGGLDAGTDAGSDAGADGGANDYATLQSAGITKLQNCAVHEPTLTPSAYAVVDRYDACFTRCVLAATCDEIHAAYCGDTTISDFRICISDCAPERTPVDGFDCGSGVMIPHAWVCDSEVDCDSWADEENCAPFVCTDNEEVATLKARCDGITDCTDGSDEVGCSLVCN